MLLGSLVSDMVTLHQRLAEALIYHSTYWEGIEGEPWLIYNFGTGVKIISVSKQQRIYRLWLNY